ncbi:cadmium resistance transporter [Halorubrum sp. DTA98]|uniref:cadmium resistance transporter n=1 Tax=Halorubrum sp. DTA98 TaxID=3402163 RepID=UPI003AAFF51E
MEPILFVALLFFAATNLDTFVVLVAFLIDDDYRTPEVFFGHSVGVVVGLTGAVLGALLAAEWLHTWTFLLGVVPLGLGIWGLSRPESGPETDELQVVPGPIGRVGVVSVIAVGLAGENLAVYVPFFAGLSTAELTIVVAAYVVASGGLFLLAWGVARRTVDLGVPAWVDRLLVPIVLLLVGAYILIAGWFVA